MLELGLDRLQKELQIVHIAEREKTDFIKFIHCSSLDKIGVDE